MNEYVDKHVRRHWTSEEDAQLMLLAKEFGADPDCW
jgi:hypothetical protein